MAVPYAEVIGDPIAHSKSPVIHNFWLERLGLPGEYRACRVTADALPGYLESRRADSDWRGCNVTVPHKQAVIPLLDSLSPLAERVHAVNTVLRDEAGLRGANTDVNGVVDALPEFGVGRPRTACLIGSGGAAYAAMAAFRLLGVSKVLLNVRNAEKGRLLLEHSGMPGQVRPIDDGASFRDADLIVNASVLGMKDQASMPDALIAAVDSIEDKETVVLDMVYAPLETELLLAARRRGLRAVDGLAMLVSQAATAFEAFFGAPPLRREDRELRALLTS
jgi:shikimate dehydrogenase